MSYFTCSNCHERHEPFGGSAVLDEGVAMLAEFPFEDRRDIANDIGQPISVAGQSAVTDEYRRLAGVVWRMVERR